ncbi:MAG: apolipoprotein N-acyltransferase [Bacteroidia bacterium]|nr:MAG: apolipoprotein N-acyltransferase [Bacteroidia bacterium]
MIERIFRHKLLLYSLLTGFLLALSWPARGFPFLVFFAFVPLFWVEDRLLARRDENRAIVFLLYAWAAFFVFNLLTTWWIMFATVPGMIAAVLLNATFMAIPWWLMHLSRRILPSAQGPLPVIIFWIAFEFLHARWELSWSWLDLGNVFAAYPAWVQWYSATGTAGGSLWVLTVNILLFFFIRQLVLERFVGKRARWNAILALMVFAVPSVISFYTWITYEEDARPVSIVIVQPAEDPYEQMRSRAELEQHINNMIDLADSRISPATRFVIAPEGANPHGIWKHEAEQHYTIRALRAHIDENPGIAWIMGSFTYELFDPRDDLPVTARQHPVTGDYFNAYNSAFMVEAGRPVQYYHKSKLVPGIERMPYFRVLGPLGRLVDRFGGIAGSLGTQDTRDVFISAEQRRVAPAVCYESIYGDFMAGYILNGASLIFIITNDGWWRDTPGYRQHLQYARLRAIETRRSVARSASTGISAFINQRGEIIKETNWWEPAAISATLNENNRITFYARTGNFLGKISLFVSVLFLFFMISQRIIKRRI